jgi:hypothetical protein
MSYLWVPSVLSRRQFPERNSLAVSAGLPTHLFPNRKSNSHEPPPRLDSSPVKRNLK